MFKAIWKLNLIAFCRPKATNKQLLQSDLVFKLMPSLVQVHPPTTAITSFSKSGHTDVERSKSGPILSSPPSSWIAHTRVRSHSYLFLQPFTPGFSRCATDPYHHHQPWKFNTTAVFDFIILKCLNGKKPIRLIRKILLRILMRALHFLFNIALQYSEA